MRETTHVWPRRPYKGFGNYGPEDVALFAGRNTAIAEFAERFARSRLLLLHGFTGCGKSSFLRAGVIPMLEDRVSSFAFTKNPDRPSLRPASLMAKAVFIRSTDDPLKALATAVFGLVDDGYDIGPPGRSEHLSLDDAKLGCSSVDVFTARVEQEPLELIRSLERIAARLPVTPVLVVDQAEEVITQRRRSGQDHAEPFFTFLSAFGKTSWTLNIIVSMRTEFLGVFQARLRRLSGDDAAIRDFFLDELTEADLLEAISRPTLAEPVEGFGVPRDVYKFSFEDGLAERIVRDIVAATDAEGLVSGSLPFLQVVCESLYKATRPRDGDARPWVITSADYSVGDIITTLSAYVDNMLDAFPREHGTTAVAVARTRWKDILTHLVKTQADGSITTATKTAGELRAVATKSAADFDAMLAYLSNDEQSLLRHDRLRGPDDAGPVEKYSLRHDAVGLVLNAWKMKREGEKRDLVFKEQIQQLMPAVGAVELTCTFDQHGSGEQVRRYLDIHSRQTVVDYRIPYGFSVSPPGRTFLPPEGLVRPIETPRPSALPSRFISTKPSPDQVYGYIEITGELSARTGYVGFEMRQPFERAFGMTRAEVEQAYKDQEWTTEYAGFWIQLPTGELRLSVIFPPSFNLPGLEAGPVVFMGTNEITHDAEIARIRPGFRLDGNVATLRVSDPQQGLQYAIYWMPPK